MIQYHDHDLDALFILSQLGHIGLILPGKKKKKNQQKKKHIFSIYFHLPFIWESLFELEFLILILFHALVSLGGQLLLYTYWIFTAYFLYHFLSYLFYF